MIVRQNRRLFLRGLGGVVVGLPLLESLKARKAEAAEPFRYAVFIRQGNGVAQKNGSEPERFFPSQVGALTKQSMEAESDRAVSELAAYASQLLIVRGVDYPFDGITGCGHADGGVMCLTAAKSDAMTKNKALAMGESIDNKIVRELEPAGNEPLNLYAGRKESYLSDVLSYRGPKDRRAAEGNPKNAYRRLFGMPMTGGADAQNVLASQRKSVNDLVRAEMQALLGRPSFSKTDRDRLNLHFEAIRDLEVKLGCALPDPRRAEIDGLDDARVADDALIEKIIGLQSDVIALALSCGLTHAVTLQIGNGNDGTQYMVDGVQQERFHFISHRIRSDGDSGDKIDGADVKHHKIDRKFAVFFRNFLDRLSAYKTPTGTLLDEGVSIWLNDLATGPPHGRKNLPYVLAGNCGGALRTGAYVDAGGAKSNKFLNTIGAAVGVKNKAGQPLDDFGDASLAKGRITQMLPG